MQNENDERVKVMEMDVVAINNDLISNAQEQETFFFCNGIKHFPFSPYSHLSCVALANHLRVEDKNFSFVVVGIGSEVWCIRDMMMNFHEREKCEEFFFQKK